MKTKRHKIILHTECMVTNTKNLLEVIRKHYNIKSNIQNNFHLQIVPINIHTYYLHYRNGSYYYVKISKTNKG